LLFYFEGNFLIDHQKCFEKCVSRRAMRIFQDFF